MQAQSRAGQVDNAAGQVGGGGVMRQNAEQGTISKHWDYYYIYFKNSTS